LKNRENCIGIITKKSSSYDSAKRYVKEAQNKGFKNAFLVAFDGENKITIEEALKRLK